MADDKASTTKTAEAPTSPSFLKKYRLELSLVVIAAIVFLSIGLKVWHFDEDDTESERIGNMTMVSNNSTTETTNTTDAMLNNMTDGNTTSG